MGIDKQETYLTRRRFFFVLAASVVAVNCPLPIGFPEKLPEKLPQGVWKAVIIDMEVEPEVMYAKLLINGQTCTWRIPV
jgi:hypothetical protein